MPSARDQILDWIDQGLIAPQNRRAALQLGGALPSNGDWRAFLEQFLLWIGVVLVVAGVIFFFAFNWDSMGRYTKFALAEVALAIALGLVWWVGLERAGGRAALLGAALLVGALFALVGQTYQTGADTFELFAVWAGAIIPWVLVARSAALWIIWIALVNLAVSLYFQAMGGIFGVLFGPARQLWLLFALNTVALAVWEICSARRVEWLRERWAARVLATASGACATALALFDIVEWRSAGGLGIPVWVVWLGCAYAFYRRRIHDIFVLAGAVLSVIVVATAFLSKHLLRGEGGFAFLLIGLIIIAMSAAGGSWLRTVARKEKV